MKRRMLDVLFLGILLVCGVVVFMALFGSLVARTLGWQP